MRSPFTIFLGIVPFPVMEIIGATGYGPSSPVITFFQFQNNQISLSDFITELLSKNLIMRLANIPSKLWKVPEELHHSRASK